MTALRRSIRAGSRNPRAHLYALSFGFGPHVCPGRLVAVGAGNGAIEREDLPAGVLVRLFQEIYRYEVTVDPDNPPLLRTDTVADRYGSFPVVLRGWAV